MLLFDDVPAQRRIERAHNDARGPAVNVRRKRREGRYVKQGRADQVPITVAQVERLLDRDACPERRCVCVHGALRPSGRTRGVHDVERIVARSTDRRLAAAGRGAQMVVLEATGRSSFTLAHADPVPNRRAGTELRGHLLDGWRELGIEEHDGGTAVLYDEGNFARRQPPVDGHDDCTDAGGSEVGLDELHAVSNEQEHAVTRMHTQAFERPPDLVRARGKLGVGKPHAATGVDVGLALTAQRRPFGKQQSDVLAHVPFLASLPDPLPLCSRLPADFRRGSRPTGYTSNRQHAISHPAGGHKIDRQPSCRPEAGRQVVCYPTYASAMTGFSSTPIRSISMRTTSPGRKKRCGEAAMPTPAGVPVETMSPGSRVNTVDKSSTRA